MEQYLKRAIRTGVPTLLWGPPGVGKTATVAALGRSLGLPVETVIASIREPADFLGLPVLRDGEAVFWPPAWAKRLAEAGRGILFLDEISTAPPAVQAALLRVVLERTVGDLELPDEVTILAAANPADIAAGGWELSAPLANRFKHLQYKLEPATWATSFPSYWGAPPTLPGVAETEWSKARALIAGFIRARPGLLLRVPEAESERGKAWPSPRSWDHASRELAVVWEDGGKTTDAADGVAGCVGEGPALEFLAWAQDFDLPDPEELLADPQKFKMPSRGDQAFAILAAVAAAACNKEPRWRAAWKIMAKAADTAPDIAAAAAITLAKGRKPAWDVPEEAAVFLPVLRDA